MTKANRGNFIARTLGDIEREVRTLSKGDKRRLLRTLVEELELTADADVGTAWSNEVIRRSRELDEGLVEAIPAAKVLGNARAELKQ